MSGKRRGGRSSGSFASQGATPAGGLPAPGVTQALASLAAQLESFGKEVRDLKALLSEVAGRDKASRAGDSTLDLNLAAFGRQRRIRLGLCLAAPFTLCLAVAAYSAFKPDRGPPRRALQPIVAPVVPPKAVQVPAPTTHKAVEPEKAPPLAVSPPAADRAARLVRRNPGVSLPRAVPEPPRAPPKQPPMAAPLPTRPTAELSGGAPILD